jgi:transcriptional regulator with XRE-family HTH domain
VREVVAVPERAEGPTVLRILLGHQLRRLREERDISAKDAARAIRASESKISRIELGRNAIREIDVLDLLTFYGVPAAEREQLLSIAEQSSQPGWWHRYNDILPDWFQTYIGMEQAATQIRVYEPMLIPGLLQSEDYAQSVISLCDFPPSEAERHVVIRKERQRRFRDGQIKLWVIIDEIALRRPLGGVDKQIAQLEYLQTLLGTRKLTLQVIPEDVPHATPGAFSILRFDPAELQDVVYVENLTGALYIDKQAEVDRYMLAMERLSVAACTPRETPAMIDAVISRLRSNAA